MLNNHLIFGGIDFGDYGIIESVSRPNLPPITQESKEIMGRDGILHRGTKLGPLNITARIRLFAHQDIDRLMSEVVGLLFSRQTQELNYKGYETYYDAVLVDAGDQAKRRDRIGLMELTFNVPSGFGRSKFRTVFKGVTSRKIPLTGDLPVKPYIEINSPSFQITNLRTGEFVKVDTTYSNPGFVLDFDKETVKIGDRNEIRKLYRSSSFFEIEDGDTIKSTAPMTLSFYERYLYDR